MYKQEGIKPYGQDTEKGEQVERMFDNIAPTYDTLNHRLSWNIDKGWRRKAIKQLSEEYPRHCHRHGRLCHHARRNVAS